MKNKDDLIDLGLVGIFIVYIVSLYANEWFAINTPDMEKKQTPLYDRGHQLLTPAISTKIPDYILTITLIYFIVRWYRTNKLLLANYFFLIALLFIMRIFIFMGTETPTPLKKCSNQKWKHPQAWSWKHIKWWFGEDDRTCVDNMFSGHTAHAAGIFLFTLFFSTYYSEKLAMLLSLLAIMITLIWSRMHYTSDVAVGFLLTVGYFFTAFEIEKIFL